MIIDRIEDGIAVVETDSGHIEVSAEALAPGVREGDAVTLKDGIYVTDRAETDRRRQYIIKLQEDLWE